MTKTLAIFAKEPRPGHVKTRLVPPLSHREAAELYGCMLADTLAKVSALPGVEPWLFYEESGEAVAHFTAAAPGMACLPQEGAHLGERMANALRTLLQRGCDAAAIIGTDSPDLPPAVISEAFLHLQSGCDAVFGPSEDGGYYLVAMSKLHPALFHDIPWSSEHVLAKSLARAEAANLSVRLLPTWYDVDTAADLTRPGLVSPHTCAPLTREFLLRLGTGD
ncbi:MAG TPA: TIGR04282 family arsenosugar biosynthesis glycosyltransferase [Geobacteraceae bacterium]